MTCFLLYADLVATRYGMRCLQCSPMGSKQGRSACTTDPGEGAAPHCWFSRPDRGEGERRGLVLGATARLPKALTKVSWDELWLDVAGGRSLLADGGSRISQGIRLGSQGEVCR